jgi:hypothetical protein
MTALFNPPEFNIPEPVVPPPPPTTDDAAERQKASDLKRKRKGRQATILTSPEGVGAAPNVGAPTLLGS